MPSRDEGEQQKQASEYMTVRGELTWHPVEEPVPHDWTLDEYHRAIDAGVFGDRRIELLHGEIVDMSPMNEPHIGAVRFLAGLFFQHLGWPRVSSRTPIILPSDGEPEPDVALFEQGAPLKPHVDQVQLVIEVSQATRRRDLGSKLEDYLRDGLRELWIIDLVEQSALMYRRGELVARHGRGTGAQLVAELVPEVSVDLDEVFRAARIAPQGHAG
jgi:Uma2 family endonuclease